MADRFLRLPAVLDQVGFKKSKVYEMVAEGAFPAPLRVGRTVLWSERQVQDWMQSKLAA